jgi:N-acetylglutamate synthase-like GNAT family acetyltransferase
MNQGIRPYDPALDREALFQLWEAAHGETWPLPPEGFYARIDPQAAHHQVAVADGKLLGFIALSRDGQENGSIFALMTRPNQRSEDIESKLLETATQHLQRLGIAHLRFGGGRSYFWPGVPTDQPQLQDVLQQHGWQAGGEIADMVGEVETSRVPEEITNQIAHSGAHLRLATAEDSAAILAFEERHFPRWLRTASRLIERGDFDNILLAELDGMIVGTNFLTRPGDPDVLWRRMLGEDCAVYGALGVSEVVRGRYIGYALAVRAAEILHDRRAKRIFLGWVFSTAWYARLGYQVWRTYWRMTKELS